MAKKYDAIIIGTGQSGQSLAAKLAGNGMKVAIIERKLFGGTFPAPLSSSLEARRRMGTDPAHALSRQTLRERNLLAGK